MNRIIASLAVITALTASAISPKDKGYATINRPTAEAHIGFLASDELQGRAAGYPSGQIAACGFRFYPDKALLIQAWIALFIYLFDLPRFITASRLPDPPGKQELLLYIACIVLSLIIPVIIKLFYGQVFFLLHDFPQYTTRELLATSRRLTSGHKLKLLYIYISFLPYLIPCLLSCGIAMLWVLPYINATLAEFYLDLVREKR